MLIETEYDPSQDNPFINGSERRPSLTPPPAPVQKTEQAGTIKTKEPSFATRAAASIIGLGVVGGFASGAIALNAENAQSLEDSRATLASSSISPSAEYGDLAGPAQEAVEALATEQGIDPSTFSSETILNEARDAMSAEIAATGAVDPGDQFTVNLSEASGGFITGGATQYSIDITSNNAEALADSNQPKQ